MIPWQLFVGHMMKYNAIGGIVIAGIFFIYLSRNIFSLNMCHNFFVKSDELLSSHGMALLQDQLALCACNKQTLHDTIQEIKKTIPCIKSLSISYCPHGCVVHVTAHKPQCIINDSLIFAQGEHLLSRSFFSEQEIIGLPSLSIKHEDMPCLKNVISQSLRTLPIHLYDTHSVHLENNHTILSSDKTNKHFRMIHSIDQYITQELFDHYERIKNHIVSHETVAENVVWMIDVRFANYIVTYRALRGDGYGTTC